MNINHTKMTLEINSCKNYEILEVRQGDKGSRIIDFAFTVNGETVNLTSTMSAKVNATVDDVIVADSVAAVVDTENNVVTVTLTDAMLALSGICKMDIVLTEGDEIITAETVCLRIGKSVINDASKAFPGASSIVEITKEVENARGGQNSLGARLDTVDTNFTKKADKTSTLAGYGITDAYTKEKTDQKLARKLDSMPFDDEPKYNSPCYLTSGAVYNALLAKADSNFVYTKAETDDLLGGKADKSTTLAGLSKLKDDLGDIRKVSPNLFDKTKVIMGKRPDGRVYGQYTDYPSRSAYSIKFNSFITENCKIYFNQKPEEIIFYKEKNGVYERLGAYTTPQQDENGNYYYQILDITSTRWLSAIEISYTTKNTNVDAFMMCINSLPDGYIPFGIYLESFNNRVATIKDISELKENKVITDTITGFGIGALAEESDSKYNVAVGVNALRKAKHTEENDTGYYNVAVGHNAGSTLETGSHNTAIGFQSLNKNTKGHYNTACGEDALFNTKGSNNTGCGCRALQNNTTGTHNTALGSALYNCSTGYMNNAIGNEAGNSITTDTRCNFFGKSADKDTSDIIDNSMALGHSAKVTKSNQVVIGNASVEEFVFGNKKIIFNSDGTVSWEIIN